MRTDQNSSHTSSLGAVHTALQLVNQIFSRDVLHNKKNFGKTTHSTISCFMINKDHCTKRDQLIIDSQCIFHNQNAYHGLYSAST